jgi:beta-carotene ketolase (CrtO type)
MDNIKAGRIGDELPFYIGAPSVLDRSLVPAGSEGESIWVYVGAVPLKMTDGTDWQDIKKGYLDRVIDKLEPYSPGFRDSVVGAQIGSPDDFNLPWVFKGSSRAVDLIPSQMGPWRPSPGLPGYDTAEIDAVWRTGHGTHPTSGTHGWPGRLTARDLLKRERSPRLPRRRSSMKASGSPRSA